MRNTEAGCILSEQQAALKKEVSSLDVRMDKLEKDFATMRSETLDGFKQGAEVMREIGEGVSNLAHDFGQRFNNIETTVVAEKVKWGRDIAVGCEGGREGDTRWRGCRYGRDGGAELREVSCLG